MAQVYLIAAQTLLGIMIGMYCLGLAARDNSLIDIAYGPAFVVAGWTVWLSYAPEPFSFRPLLLLLLITVWGIRLGLHIGLRHRGRGEDFRYRAFRGQWGNSMIWRSFLQIYLLQGAIILVLLTPVLITIAQPGLGWRWLDLLGLSMFCFGFFWEAVSDWQLRQFRKVPGNQGAIMASGLWRYSRHPNYFGEAVLWWGIFVIGSGSPAGLYGLVSPLTILFLLLKVSGIPMLEERYRGNAQFEAYKQRTNAFFPWRPHATHEGRCTPGETV